MRCKRCGKAVGKSDGKEEHLCSTCYVQVKGKEKHGSENL